MPPGHVEPNMKKMISCSKIIKRKEKHTHDSGCIVECMASDSKVQYHGIEVNAPWKLHWWFLL